MTSDQPRPFETKKCAYCPALVIWTITKKGERAPIDADPVADGDIAVEWGLDGQPHSRVLTVEQRARRMQNTLRKSHFATCPKASIARGRRR